MLTKEGILRLYNARMTAELQILRCTDHGIHNIHMGNSRVLNGSVLSAGSFHADSSACNYDISAQYILLHTATGAHTQKSMGSALG